MSISVAILKVLSAHPGGRASVAALNVDLKILSSPEWYARMRAAGIRAGSVSLFGSKLVTRDASGWSITDAGRNLLARLESGERVAEGPVLRLVSSSKMNDDDPSQEEGAASPLKASA